MTWSVSISPSLNNRLMPQSLMRLMGVADSNERAPEIVTGGRDGCVRLWDTRVKEPVLALEPGEGETARDCWTVAFGNAHSTMRTVVSLLVMIMEILNCLI